MEASFVQDVPPLAGQSVGGTVPFGLVTPGAVSDESGSDESPFDESGLEAVVAGVELGPGLAESTAPGEHANASTIKGTHPIRRNPTLSWYRHGCHNLQGDWAICQIFYD
ncbi:MAG TPA: hypothetical protein VM470_03470 [Acidimicrobiia bacterium]|nr:hypothetical protein [Acidimicrobiia bacterium]